MTSLARRERHALCDTALTIGPDEPTRCGDWDVRALVCHLLVRERHPVAASGILVPAASRLTEHAMARLGRRDFAALVESLRKPWPVPFAVPGVEKALNTTEFFVHHEDIRRAQPNWSARVLSDSDQRALWGFVRFLGRGLVKPSGVPVRIEWGELSATLARGDEPVVLRGLPSELTLALYGRQQVAEVSYDGPPGAAHIIRRADLGV